MNDSAFSSPPPPPSKRQRVGELQQTEDDQGISFVSQKLLDEKILSYFINEMVPLVTIEKDSFKDLVLLGRSSKLKVMSRKTLVIKIQNSFRKSHKAIFNVLSQQEFVSATADLWTKGKR